jgi:hypothetical protein
MFVWLVFIKHSKLQSQEEKQEKPKTTFKGLFFLVYGVKKKKSWVDWIQVLLQQQTTNNNKSFSTHLHLVLVPLHQWYMQQQQQQQQQPIIMSDLETPMSIPFI